MPRAVLYQPSRGAQPEPRQPAAHEVSRVGANRQRRRRGRRQAQRSEIRGKGDDDLADMPGRLHVAKGAGNLQGAESPVRQWLQRAVGKQGHQIDEHASRSVGALRQQLIRIDAEIRDIVAERTHADPRVLVKVAFAEFQHAAEGAQQAQIPRDGVSGEGIQNHIDTLTPGGLQHFVAEGERTGVEDMIGAEQLHEVALLGGTRRREDFRTQMLGQLDRGDADAAGAAVNEHALPLAQTGEFVQRIVGGEKCGRHSGRGGKRPRGRFAGDGERAGAHAIGEGGRCERDHLVPAGDFGHRGADTGHDARHFHAKCRSAEPVLDRFVGQQAHGIHDVTEIQARRTHLDLDAVFGQGLRIGSGPP